MRIMITGCAGPAGRALLRLLAPTAHEIIGVDMAPQDDPAFTATAVVPAAADPGMIPALRHLLVDHRIDLLIPTVSDELSAVSRAAAAPDWPVATVIGAPEAVEVCDDKLLTMQALALAGTPVPRFALPSVFPTTTAALREMGGALIIKPRVGRGGRGVRLIRRASDVDWASLDDSLIVQEFAPGTEYAPMVHCSTAGSEPTVIVLEKTELKQGAIGNALSVRRLPAGAASDVAATASRAISALGLHGPVDLDVRRTVDGLPVVLEVNARFGANSDHAPEILASVLTQPAAVQAVPAGSGL